MNLLLDSINIIVEMDFMNKCCEMRLKLTKLLTSSKNYKGEIMRKIQIIILTICFFYGTSGFTQKKLEEYNGYWWEGMNTVEKFRFLEGYTYCFACVEIAILAKPAVDVLTKKEKRVKTKEEFDVLFYLYDSFNFSNVSYGEFIDGIDNIYKDYANKRIPVMQIIILVAARVKGKINNEELELRLVGLRKGYHQRNN